MAAGAGSLGPFVIKPHAFLALSHDLMQINERSAEGDMLKSRRICRRAVPRS
jgi:hypothetical protein